MNVLVSGLIGSLLTIIVTMFIVPRTNKKALADSLDSKSEWRKSLFQAASRETITMNDVYLLRASLRYKAHSEGVEINSNSYDFEMTFNNITKKMIDFCDNLEIKSDKNVEKLSLSKEEQKEVRIYLRYLLKAHWEWNLHPDSFMFKHGKGKAKVIREVLKQVEEIE